MHITAQSPRLRNDLYCVEWDVKLYYTIPGEPVLASFIAAKAMEVVVTTGAIRRAKLQSNRHHQQTQTQLFTGRMSFLLRNQQCQSTEGKSW